MFELSDKAKQLQNQLNEFMDAYIYPNEHKHHEQIEQAQDRWAPVPIIEELIYQKKIKKSVRLLGIAISSLHIDEQEPK